MTPNLARARKLAIQKKNVSKKDEERGPPRQGRLPEINSVLLYSGRWCNTDHSVRYPHIRLSHRLVDDPDKLDSTPPSTFDIPHPYRE